VNIAAAEGFIDAAGINGSGFPFFPVDGAWGGNTPAPLQELVYADIPLTTINALSNTTHTIYVHGKDAVGNWGNAASTPLVIDKLAPAVSALTLTPSAANNQPVAISMVANDVATGNTNITAGEYFIDPIGTPADGTGTAMAVTAASPSTTVTATLSAATVTALAAGNRTISVHAKDAAGNWSTRLTVTLRIDRTAPTFASITLNPNTVPSGTATTNLTVNGSSDSAGGSGVVGGEYWFGALNITAGTGTAFTGLTNVPISIGSLPPGTQTVRVRIRDAAGNWSSTTTGIRTATLTVTAPVTDLIFSDGFESGSTSAWTSRTPTTGTTLQVTTGAALAGTYGLQVQGNAGNYVSYTFGALTNPATGTYDAKFSFRPNGNLSPTAHDIFTGRTTGGATVIRVRYRTLSGVPQVQIQIGTTSTNTAWTTISAASTNTIQVVWKAAVGATPGSLVLYVNGAVASQTLTTTSTSLIGGVRLGSVTGGGAITPVMRFDDFASKRSIATLLP
jgi:hypothetical protein